MTASGIHINPAHEGMLRREMGVKKGQTINVGDLMKKKARDKREGNAAEEKRDTFALNAKTKFHH